MAMKADLIRRIRAAAVAMAAAFVFAPSCTTEINDDRVPGARVYVPFTTIGDWNLYGVHAAMESRRFIPQLREPSGYVWTAVAGAGYGGVLLTSDVYGGFLVFDLACPVERDPQVRVAVARGESEARCEKCGSTFDVFSIGGRGPGMGLTGPAASKNYALRRYNIVFGADGRYALLTN